MKTKLRIILLVFFVALALLIAVTYGVMVEKEEQVFFVYVLAVIFIVVAAVRIAKWLHQYAVKPMESLNNAIKEVEKGNLDYIMDHDASDEIGDACEEFEKLRIKLKETEAARNQATRENHELIGNISHDLKTPITAIKGYAEGILDGVVTTPEQQQKYVRTIYNKADDMAKLIDELAYYTKVDTNRIPYNFEKVSPVDFFYDCIDDIGMDLESKGIEFTNSCNVDSSVLVIADVEQLAKVVNNIVNNAVKYLDKVPGKIDIRLLDDGDFIKFEIEDNGKGIVAADLPNIFDRFYRTDASRNSKTGGTGIGLSICRKIIGDHGGRIWATSKVGVGTTFTFNLRKYHEMEKTNE